MLEWAREAGLVVAPWRAPTRIKRMAGLTLVLLQFLVKVLYPYISIAHVHSLFGLPNVVDKCMIVKKIFSGGVEKSYS